MAQNNNFNFDFLVAGYLFDFFGQYFLSLRADYQDLKVFLQMYIDFAMHLKQLKRHNNPLSNKITSYFNILYSRKRTQKLTIQLIKILKYVKYENYIDQ